MNKAQKSIKNPPWWWWTQWNIDLHISSFIWINSDRCITDRDFSFRRSGFFADVKGMIIINFGFIYTSKLCYRNVFFLLRSELIFYSSSLPFFHLLPFPVSLFFYYFYCGFLSCIAVINEQWISQKPQNFFKPQKHEIKNVNLPSEMMNANE